MISNNITLIGNLGSDIQVHEFGEGKCVGKVSIAHTSGYTNKQGERVERTDWFKLKVWNKTCTSMANTLKKGSRVLIEGKLASDSYEKDGQKINTVEVVVSNFQVIERKNKLEEAPEAVAAF